MVICDIEMKSYITVQCEFLKQSACSYQKKPHRSIIKRPIDKFYASSSVHNELKGKLTQSEVCALLTKEVEDEVWQILKKDLCAFIMHLAQQLGILWFTTYFIVHEDIGLFLYKVQALPNLTQFANNGH